MKPPAAAGRNGDTTSGYRLTIAGYGDLQEAWSAYAELKEAGLSESQLCLVSRHPDLAEANPEPIAERETRGLRLDVSSAELFDAIAMAATEPADATGGWMPPSQARVLWSHIRGSHPVLVAEASSSGQQVACSRALMRRHPVFLHTFNFSADALNPPGCNGSRGA